MLVFSCHADTGFPAHKLKRLGEGIVDGHLDNFVGVHAVMNAYFSGRMHQDYFRIELTYGEEDDFEGALEVRETLSRSDAVIVVDVTGTPTDKDFVIEKCRDSAMRKFLSSALHGMSFDLYEDCPDPIADEDEVDVYSEKLGHVCMLAVPCFGGDYNEGPVKCRQASVDGVTEAICRITERFPDFCRAQKMSTS